MNDEGTAAMTPHAPARDVAVLDYGPIEAEGGQPTRLGRKRDHTRDAGGLTPIGSGGRRARTG